MNEKELQGAKIIALLTAAFDECDGLLGERDWLSFSGAIYWARDIVVGNCKTADLEEMARTISVMCTGPNE